MGKRNQRRWVKIGEAERVTYVPVFYQLCGIIQVRTYISSLQQGEIISAFSLLYP